MHPTPPHTIHPPHQIAHNPWGIWNYLSESNINWWKTAPESPDLNPIENLWHEVKEYLRREVKPRNKQQLVDGILDFWDTVDTAKCRKYIRHLRKVVPRILELNGAATGYWINHYRDTHVHIPNLLKCAGLLMVMLDAVWHVLYHKRRRKKFINCLYYSVLQQV